MNLSRYFPKGKFVEKFPCKSFAISTTLRSFAVSKIPAHLKVGLFTPNNY